MLHLKQRGFLTGRDRSVWKLRCTILPCTSYHGGKKWPMKWSVQHICTHSSLFTSNTPVSVSTCTSNSLCTHVYHKYICVKHTCTQAHDHCKKHLRHMDHTHTTYRTNICPREKNKYCIIMYAYRYITCTCHIKHTTYTIYIHIILLHAIHSNIYTCAQ